MKVIQGAALEASKQMCFHVFCCTHMWNMWNWRSLTLVFLKKATLLAFVCFTSHASSADGTREVKMASALKSLSLLSQTRSIVFRGTAYGRILGSQFNRQSHIVHRDNAEDKIVLADNGETIVCWHPEKP